MKTEHDNNKENGQQLGLGKKNKKGIQKYGGGMDKEPVRRVQSKPKEPH